ncbi:MAG: hypothetical protein LBP38_05635 [Desulfovibrio sp.]|nr:hypothetical protein [Desulfovibrio sp.]
MKAGRTAPALLLLLAAGCASGPVGRLMPHIETLDLAKAYFGPPTSAQALAGGLPSSPRVPAGRSAQSADAARNAPGEPAPPQAVAVRSGQNAAAPPLSPEARVEYEWLLDDVVSVPGQEVVERFLAGRDRQGFPVYYERIRWVPAHQARRFCRVRLRADAQGRILSRSVEGDDCEDLLIRLTTF